jgi:carbon-monoxide dehydrogenase medium subunit
MKPRVFKYISVRSIDELIDALAQHGDGARILAGGQSLVPMMNLRVASPSVIVDINDCAGLGGISRSRSGVRIGAMTRHREAEHSVIVRDHLPLLAEAMPHVAHLAIRNRGTLGGSLALADPAAEMPACAMALGATMEIGSRRGTRRAEATDFFHGLYTTTIQPDEALLAVEFPEQKPGEAFAFLELSRQHGDFAIAGIAARAQRTERGLADLKIVGFGISDRPIRLNAIEEMIEAADEPPALSEIKCTLPQDVSPTSDNQYSVEAKIHLAAELIRRAVRQLRSEPGRPPEPAHG